MHTAQKEPEPEAAVQTHITLITTDGIFPTIFTSLGWKVSHLGSGSSKSSRRVFAEPPRVVRTPHAITSTQFVHFTLKYFH